MSSQKERLKQRNKAIRTYFDKKKKDNPKWTFEAVIENTAQKFYLAERTISAIISFEGVYKK